MIYSTVTLTVNDYNSTCNNKIILYRGDKNVEIRFVIKGNRFTVLESTYAQMLIKRPSATSIFSEPALIENDTFVLTITEDMIDELKEVGDYTFQIRLYDTDMTARASLPPCDSCLSIGSPIATEDESVVNVAEVNNSIVMMATDDSTDESVVFDDQGSYNKTNWVEGDLITDVRLNKVEDALYEINEVTNWLEENGGGGGATSPYISTTLTENVTVQTGEDFNLHLDFSSPNIGKGTLKIFINDVDAMSASISQGESTTVVPYTLLSDGTNKMVIYVLDRVGVMSNSLTFYVRYGSTKITSDFDAYTAYDYGSTVRYYFTPTALDTSLSLTMYMSIDGETQTGVSCTSDVRGYYTFPSTLSVGNHYCEAWVEDGSTKSNVLKFNLIILDSTSLVIASDTQSVSIEEGEQLSLDYKVYMKNNTSFITKTYVDDVLVNTGTCTLATSYYKSSSLTEGTHTVKVEAWDITETVSDYVVWTITITASTYEMKQAVTAGALFIGTAKDKSNSDENKEVWIGYDQDNNPVQADLYNFAFNSESGWVDNNLYITGNSYVEVPIAPLAENAKYGFTLDIEFLTKPTGVEDAEVLTLWNDTDNCGIKITTEEVILQSKSGSRCDLYFTENEVISVMFVIDRNEKAGKIYLNGVMCEAIALSDYSVDGVAYLEDFTVNSNVILGGKDKNGYSAIRNLRIYQVALATDEIINNFISNEIDKTAQKALVEFQKGNDLPTITVYGDFSGLGKDDKKPCDITYISPDTVKYGESFTLSGKTCQLQYQGTSSMAYPIKNYRLNLRDSSGNKWYYPFPDSQPECRYTLKADFMSSGHWNNSGLAKWVNDNLYSYDTTNEKSMNPAKWWALQNGGSIDDYRECINGFPCRLILVNDGETTLTEGQEEPTPGNTKNMGIFNFNLDKDCENTLGFTIEDFPNAVSMEVTANSDTSAGAFMSFTHDETTTETDELNYLKESFELRYCADEDNEDYGYLGMNEVVEENVVDYVTISGIKATSFISINNIEGTTIQITTPEITDRYGRYIYFYDSNGNYISYDYDFSSYAANVPEGTAYFSASINGDYITINDKTYKISSNSLGSLPSTVSISTDFIKEPYINYETVFTSNLGLKRVIDFVDNSSDEEFVANFEEYFLKDYVLRYYLLVVTLGMVDNLGKNMMFDSYDGKIWMPRFYDMDTICSYDNSGQLRFDVDIEMAQGYWNTSSSRLWTRVRDLFADELITTYKNMRQNGMTYESFMSYFYDEQIAKIPQTYYNKDFDVKYAPYIASYSGMAHGDCYQHLKRWLKQRLIFTDTLFDYAPSYTNDALTIRANTTELMSLTIETYSPVYQHVSFYNGQMSKEKISKGTSFTFTGTAQAATDQEVLIYGGSNIKRITGISTMNPNSMLIGGATKLVELDISNCPILVNVNSNKANLSAHTYLSKLDISNCPQLGGTLQVQNSPLLREINASNTAVTSLLLPSSIRNLEVLKLPSAITSLSLQDASMLHTLEFDEGNSLQTVSMTNCNALTNVVNFDLTQVPTVTLNNSYNTSELYMSKTTNLSLSNMSDLERLIYLPNNEYETFELATLTGANDYVISTFNCPKLTEFITTAPHRLSYNNGDYGDIKPNTIFAANSLDLSNTQFPIIKLLCTTDLYQLKLPTTVKNFYCDSTFDIDTDVITDAEYDVIHNELIEEYTTDYNDSVVRRDAISDTYTPDDSKWTHKYIYNQGSLAESREDWFASNRSTDYISAQEGFSYSISCTSDTATIVGLMFFDADKNLIVGYGGNGTTISSISEIAPANTSYVIFHAAYATSNYHTMEYTELYTPNIVPSSSDGSLIFSMYAPKLVTEPSVNNWDLYGLTFDNFHTFGMNNDVKPSDDGSIAMPYRYEPYAIQIKNANIIPKQYNTMLYPLLIDETLPITGRLDYSQYEGEYLSYAYAYTTSDVNITPVGSQDMDNIKYDYGKLEGTDFVDVIDVWAYADTDVSTFSTNEKITKAYIELTSSNYTSRIDEVLQYYPNCTDVYLFDDGSVTTLYQLSYSNGVGNTLMLSQVVNITFMNGYFNNLTRLSHAFKNAKKLVTVDNIPSSVKYLYYTFYGCSNLNCEFDFSSNKIESATNSDFVYTFYECSSLTYTPVLCDSYKGSMAYVFYGCSKLIEPPIIPDGVTNLSYTFRDCTSLEHDIEFSSGVTNASCCFYNCTGLKHVTSNWNNTYDNEITTTDCYAGCTAIETIDGVAGTLDEIPTAWGGYGFSKDVTTILEVEVDDNTEIEATVTDRLLDAGTIDWGDGTVTTGEITHTYTTAGTYTIKGQFVFITTSSNKSYCTKISQVAKNDTFSWSYRFSGMSKLTYVDLSNYAGELTYSSYMFQNNKLLEYANLTGCKIRSGAYMFQNNESLTTIIGLELATGCTTLQAMFYGCSGLTSLDLTNFNTSSVTNMGYMFYGCSGLTSLDLSGWDTSNVTTMADFISGASKLATFNIYILPLLNLIFNVTALSVDSLVNIMNALQTTTDALTLTIGATNLAKLSDEQIAIATDKNWSVV